MTLNLSSNSGYLLFKDLTSEKNPTKVIQVNSVISKDTVGTIKWCNQLDIYAFYPIKNKTLAFNEASLRDINFVLAQLESNYMPCPPEHDPAFL